ncbi:MAG: cysteine desulfurase family protein, partial [Candidatus Sulfotelmatobacter sp.]
MPRIYLDNNATTPVLPEVFEAMRPYFVEHFGNASSIHHHGQETRAAIERARDSVASLLGCRAAEVVFTSGGTEGDNLAIAGLTGSGDHVVTSSIEHHAVLHACKHLEDTGCEVTYLPVDGRGLVDPDDVRRALRPSTRLISIMMANNETGVLQPLEEIGKIAAESDVYFHTDAVQSAGKVPIDVERIGCDALSISGHKMHAPQGVGALYVRKGTRLRPLFYGGRHERSRRAGTENVPGIVALGKAAELALQGFERGEDKKTSALRDRLQQGILAQVEEAGVNGNGAARVPNTTNIYFDHIDGEAMVIALDLKGLAVSTGAACSSGAIEPSHVLVAMGLRPDRARASIRFSLGKQNTAEDIDLALALVPETIARLR